MCPVASRLAHSLLCHGTSAREQRINRLVAFLAGELLQAGAEEPWAAVSRLEDSCKFQPPSYFMEDGVSHSPAPPCSGASRGFGHRAAHCNVSVWATSWRKGQESFPSEKSCWNSHHQFPFAVPLLCSRHRALHCRDGLRDVRSNPRRGAMSPHLSAKGPKTQRDLSKVTEPVESGLRSSFPKYDLCLIFLFIKKEIGEP